MRTAVAIAALMLAASPVAAADRALVVGINSYPNIRYEGIGGRNDLFGAVNDARAVADLLVDTFGVPPDNILMLIDEKATREGILGAFRTHLIEASRAGDRVIFYYAGHGAQVTDDGTDEEDDLDEVLVPHDAIADLSDPAATLANIIRDDEIGDLIADLDGREVMIIVDACHSGTITRAALQARAGPHKTAYSPVRSITPFGPLRLAPGLRSLEARFDHRRETRFLSDLAIESPTGPRLAVWTAVGAAQFALEDMSIGGSAGLFTSRFVRGLAEFEADLDSDGAITPAELIGYLRGETDRYCASYDCLGQDPLPTLEAWDGYAGSVMVDRRATEIPVARLDPAAGPGAIARTWPPGAPAVPEGLLPASTGTGASVTVRVGDGGVTRLGQPLEVSVTSSVAGTLVVLDRRDDGTVVQLFPNEHALRMGVSETIAAGETRRLPGEGAPYELLADAPGRGAITAIVLDGQVDVGAVLAAHGDLRPLDDPDAYGAALATAVGRAIVIIDGETEYALEAPARAPALARGNSPYEILP